MGNITNFVGTTQQSRVDLNASAGPAAPPVTLTSQNRATSDQFVTGGPTGPGDGHWSFSGIFSGMLGALQNQGAEAMNAARGYGQQAYDVGARAYHAVAEFAAKLVHMTQFGPTACYATCDMMGRKAGVTFSPKGGANALPYNGEQSGQRLMAALQAGYPVKIPVDYKAGGQGKHGGDARDLADHCVIARAVAGTNPPQIAILDPRSSDPTVATQILTLDPATGQLKGGPYPYRITEMRFPTNYQLA